MNSRERIRNTLFFKQADKLPVDFSSTPVTGIHVSVVYGLRQYYGLDEPGTPVKVIKPYQMLGEIKDDLKAILGTDVVGIEGKGTFFGFNKENWKEWKLFNGTPVLVPGAFNIEKNVQFNFYRPGIGTCEAGMH